MLEVKHLSKVYSAKGGVTVKALDDVSVVFPEKGMVFLLGRSGSGKSTLLNVAGGLDKPDGGEVIVKGKSSKDFSGSDFDSYRNTFIGFVFQEYNILNEFTIEQNIALALQLQSKPNDKAAVAALLEQVDLAGYAKRKPNTLSGGQKQRVAIARALIKEPEIIMADEPTGALDSATGKQVLDTLKKLSENKLVIVVSHDREFAEQYGDRIIELRDGKIISDVSKIYNKPAGIAGEDGSAEQPNVAMISEDTIAIRKGEELTDADVAKIAAMLRKKGGEAIITADNHDLPGVKRACKINENGEKESFKDTEPQTPKQYDGSKTKFIKSKLPIGHAIKMGASGLKSKPIRLIFTILLSVAAFILFGVVSTFMLYDPDFSVSEALKESNYQNLELDKHYTYVRSSYRVNYDTGEETLDYTYDGDNQTLFTAKEVQEKSKDGLKFAGVYTFNNGNFNFGLVKDGDVKSIAVKRELLDYYVVDFCTGFSDCGKAYLEGNGFSISEGGRYPTAANEILITNYFAELFVNTEENGISAPSDLVGKQLRLSYNVDTPFTVTGIVKTGEIPSKYEELKKSGTLNKKEFDALKASFLDYLSHGFETLIYVSADFYKTYEPAFNRYNYGGNNVYINSQYLRKLRIDRYQINDPDVQNWGLSAYTEKTLEQNKQLLIVHNLDGSVRNDRTLGEYEVLISKNRYNEWLNDYLNNHQFNPIYDAEAFEEMGAEAGNYKYDMTETERATRIANSEKWYSVLVFRESLYAFAKDYLFGNVSNRTQNGDMKETETAFVLGFENKTQKSDLAALEEYVAAHEQHYYGILTERLKDRYELAEYAFGEDKLDTVLAALLSESYSAEEFAAKKAVLDDWFEKNNISTAVADHFTFDSKTSDSGNAIYYVTPSADKAFLALLDKIRAYVDSYYYYEKGEGEDAVAAPTDADWEALYAYAKSQTQRYYGWLLEVLNNQNQARPFSDEKVNVWSLKDGTYTDEEFAEIKAKIDAWIDSIGASKETKDCYTFSINDAVGDLYCVSMYWSGTLRIVGYIEENMNAEYCLSETFVKNHAERDSEGYYETYKTDYVQPADAKYNKIISLTDNSLSQISSVLKKEGSVFYVIDNGVVEALDRFLEMITDLEEIFLYVGLGVGVLAAFFLLNFISVSISMKRKDIGILRAVGARGSDVFKIFYAEAFLIAFICFVLASVGSYFLCFFLNRELEMESVTLRLLNFGPINIALIFGISVFVSVIATFLPVYFAARKSPVDSIRAL